MTFRGKVGRGGARGVWQRAKEFMTFYVSTKHKKDKKIISAYRLLLRQ